MKNKVFLLTLTFLFLLIPTQTEASSFLSGEQLYLKDTQEFSENTYVLSNKIDSFAEFNQDFFAAARKVSTVGTTTQDLSLAGIKVFQEGRVGDDLRIIGGEVNLDESIGGEAIILASKITVGSDAKIKGDATLIGSNIILEGDVGGDLMVFSQRFLFDGKVGGNTKIRTTDLDISNNAKVGGDMEYTASSKIDLKKNQVKGEVNFDTRGLAGFGSKISAKHFLKNIVNSFNEVWLLAVFVNLVTALVLFWLFREKILYFLDYSLINFGKESMRGVLVGLLSPLFLILLFLTGAGFWFGVLGVLMLLLTGILAQIGAGFLVGALIKRVYSENLHPRLTYNSLTLGVICLEAVKNIPFLGWVFNLLFMAAAFGTLTVQFYQKFKNIRN